MLLFIGSAQALEIRVGNLQTQVFFYLSGEVKLGDAAKFKAAWIDKGYDPDLAVVGLNSPGGSVVDGLEIGRFLRDRRATTVILDIPSSSTDDDFPYLMKELDSAKPGECYSSCALIFMGGLERIIPQGSNIGFHQFAFSDKQLNVDDVANASQQLSSSISSYLISMGASPKLFETMSNYPPHDMFKPSRIELDNLSITTSKTFKNFSLKLNKGVISTSATNSLNAKDYELVHEIEFMCNDNKPIINFYAENDSSGLQADAVSNFPDLVFGWQLVTKNGTHDFDNTDLRLVAQSRLLVSLELDPTFVPELFNGTFEVRVNSARASGFFLSAVVDASDNRAEIEHALKACM